jgi:hypothetical protein
LNPEDILLENSGSGEQREESQQNQQLISQLKTKQRDQEKTIGSLKHKEVLLSSGGSFPPWLTLSPLQMEYEKTILELNSSLKKSESEIDLQVCSPTQT